jgi:hypothetical protein
MNRRTFLSHTETKFPLVHDQFETQYFSLRMCTTSGQALQVSNRLQHQFETKDDRLVNDASLL